MARNPDFNPYRWYKEFGARLLLAKISAYEYVVDEAGSQRLDGRGNPIPTGQFRIEFLDRNVTHSNVPLMQQVVGNSAWTGALPEIGALCVVGFREGNTSIILGFLPKGMANLVSLRGEVPTLQPGEMMLQASDTFVGSAVNDTPDLGAQAMDSPQYFSAARIFLDRYGRIVVVARNYECVYGPALVDDYTPDVSFLRDPVTGYPIMFRERFCDGKAENRVDQGGNVVQYCAGDLHLIVDGTLDLQVGALSLGGQAATGFKDRLGNKIQIESGSDPGVKAGDVSVKSVRGDAVVTGGANVLLQAGGNIEESALRSKTETVGDVLTRTVGNNLQEYVGRDKTVNVGGTNTEVVVGSAGESVAGSKTVLVGGQLRETSGTRILTATNFTIVAASVKISATSIELGDAAISKIVSQLALTTKYNTHVHPTPGGPPVPLLDDLDFHTTVRVGP